MADNVETFDPAKRKPDGKTVDVDSPFFTARREPFPDYSKCQHDRLGFEYSIKYRKVYCKCGVEVEPFDAVVALAQGEQRLQSTRRAIEAERQRKAEEKAKRPFTKETRGWCNDYDRTQRVTVSRTYTLECGHTATQFPGRGFKRHWKTAHCAECYKQHQLKAQGVPTVGVDNPEKTAPKLKW